jgi:hypothetical protein
MNNSTQKSKESSLKEELNHPEQVGKKAIEADKKINKQNETTEQKDSEEKKDAEQWRNEG